MPLRNISKIALFVLGFVFIIGCGPSDTDYQKQLHGIWKLNKSATLDTLKNPRERSEMEKVFEFLAGMHRVNEIYFVLDMENGLLINKMQREEGRFTIASQNKNVLTLSAVQDRVFGVAAGKPFIIVTLVDEKNMSVAPYGQQGYQQSDGYLVFRKVGNDPAAYQD